MKLLDEHFVATADKEKEERVHNIKEHFIPFVSTEEFKSSFNQKDH